MAIKQGWTGRVFEDFAVGDVYEHPLGRTILAADNVWFSCLTMNTNPIHFDAEYAARTEFKKPLVNSCFTLALVTGQSVIDLTMNARRQPRMGRGADAEPALRGRYRLLARAKCSRRANRNRVRRSGIVRVKTTGVNQHGTTVIEFTRTFMVWKRGTRAAERPDRVPESRGRSTQRAALESNVRAHPPLTRTC